MTLKKPLLFVVLVLIVFVLCGCNQSKYELSDTKIIPASRVQEYIGKPDTVIIDMQPAEGYAEGHVKGAVSITKDDIVINVPVQNTLTSKNKLSKLMSANGVAQDSTIIAYDSDKMTAARLFWTMLVYGSDKVLVVDGGLEAIKAAGIELTTDVPEVVPTEYQAGEKDETYLAAMADVKAQLDEPDQNTILLDVRSDEEYYESGKVPSSVMMNYQENFYQDGTFKNTQTTRINYLQAGIKPESNVIMYCQTSMRAAPVFLRLYDAGYRNIKIYDGAFLEWSLNPNNAVERPAGAVAPSAKDAS